MSFFQFFQPPSDEEKAAMQAAHDRMHMADQDFKHSTQRLFEELNHDQMRTLQAMLQVIQHRTNDPLVALWEGIVVTEMKHRFNICITCGVNHDEDIPRPEEETAGDENSTTDLKATSFSRTTELSDLSADEEDTPLPTFGISDEDRIKMEEYHLDDVYDSDSGQFLYFKCTGITGTRGPCGVTYPSIEDRMLKPPEHCSGCFQRMMHG